MDGLFEKIICGICCFTISVYDAFPQFNDGVYK